MIEGEGARLAKLVDDLLDLSKIQAGAVAPQADWCDLHDVVALGRARTCARDHPIEFALPADLPLVRADAAQLERVFSNLIENAVKFSPPRRAGPDHGRASAPGRVTVRVIDHGRGDPEPAPRARVRAVLPRSRRQPAPARVWGSRSAAASSRPTAARSSSSPAPTAGTSFAVSFPVVPQPEAVG